MPTRRSLKALQYTRLLPYVRLRITLLRVAKFMSKATHDRTERTSNHIRGRVPIANETEELLTPALSPQGRGEGTRRKQISRTGR